MNLPTQTSIHANSAGKSGRAQNVCVAENAARDLACITLICNLEAITSECRKKSMADRIETATKTANTILSKLLDFSIEHFDEPEAHRLQEQIASTRQRCKDHEGAIKSLSWLSAFKSLMFTNSIDPATIATYDLLGKSLRSTCGFLFTEMLGQMGDDSQVQAQISQSSEVFLEELKSVWL